MADSAQAGSSPAEVLYRAWVESGLAREGYPVWLTYWSGGGLPEEELRVGVVDVRPDVADDFLSEARTGGAPSVRRLDRADAHYLAAVPLAGGAVVTAVVPPLRELRFSSPLGPLFNPAMDAEPDPLTLVPLALISTVSGKLSWRRKSHLIEARMGPTPSLVIASSSLAK